MTDPSLDTALVAAELLRALRGARSQVQWSRRLGYRSNVAYAWESGRRWPTAAETLRAVRRSGIELDAALEAFLGQRPPWADELDVATPAGVARLLDELRGGAPISDLARRAGVSRSAMSRWLSGATQPRLPEFLGAVEAASVRLVDFVTALVPAAQVPSVAPLWARLEARRRGAFEAPWTQAVLRALELVDYRALPAHEPGWVARRLGITPEEEAVCLDYLERSGQVRWDGARWAVEALAVDTRANPAVGPHLKAHWTGVARDRLVAGAPGQFSYNVFTVSERDLARIRELHLAYYQELRAIVAGSEPAERVVVANVQLFALDGPLPDPQR